MTVGKQDNTLVTTTSGVSLSQQVDEEQEAFEKDILMMTSSSDRHTVNLTASRGNTTIDLLQTQPDRHQLNAQHRALSRLFDLGSSSRLQQGMCH